MKIERVVGTKKKEIKNNRCLSVITSGDEIISFFIESVFDDQEMDAEVDCILSNISRRDEEEVGFIIIK